MERNHDEVIADMLIQLDSIERRMTKADKRLDLTIKRLDLTVKRMVKAEQRLEHGEKRMELFDKKLVESIREQREFSKVQSRVNKYFLNAIRKNGHKS